MRLGLASCKLFHVTQSRRSNQPQPTPAMPPNLPFAQPLNRPNAPRWRAACNFPANRGALVLCALFLAVGAALVDDYGLSLDETTQRRIAAANLKHILGEGRLQDSLLEDYRLKASDRYYGVAFELPLLLVERALGLRDSRSMHLARHILTHAFFLCGGLCCWLLARRLFGNRLLATFALLLFLLHPRLYAHSFFNSKDSPFASMLMIALLLTHRAFARDSPPAFLLCGAGVGVLVNLRVMGLVLFVAVLAMRALDLLQASGWRERRRILKTGGTFALAAGLSLYAASPYLWADPLAFLEGVATFAHHPLPALELFQGEYVDGRDPPKRYLPVWFSISTPPTALLLGLVGAAWILRQGAQRPAEALRNGPLRFALLLAACFAAPVVAAAVLGSTLYNGWRQMHFIYAPFCLLATFGLHWTASAGGVRRRAAAYGLAALGLAAVVASMAAIHPYQHLYFNILADRTTPERLRTQYQMDYWGTAVREGLEHLLERYPSSSIHVAGAYGNIGRAAALLPEAERRRISKSPAPPGYYSFYIGGYPWRQGLGRPAQGGFAPSLYDRRIYNSTILTVAAVDPNLAGEAAVDGYRRLLSAAAAGDALVEAGFRVHLHEGSLVYVRDACGPDDFLARFFLRTVPLQVDALPAWRRRQGFDALDFDFVQQGVRFDGTCLASVPLPDYDIARISTGQYAPHGGELWRGEFVPPRQHAPF